MRIAAERHNGVVVLSFDRPEARNALDAPTAIELTEALRGCAHTDGIYAVVLTGAPPIFCAGGDIKAPRPEVGVWSTAGPLPDVQIAIRTLHALPLPTVAAVEGAAIGAGWGLALACDLIVAGQSAYFSAPFLSRGLLPDAGLGWLLPRLVGRQAAMEILLLGKQVDAQRALDLGLVNRVVSDGEALSEATELAAAIATGPPVATRLTKQLVVGDVSAGYEEFLERELLSVALNGHGDEAAEGRKAFAEQRPPNFHVEELGIEGR